MPVGTRTSNIINNVASRVRRVSSDIMSTSNNTNNTNNNNNTDHCCRSSSGNQTPPEPLKNIEFGVVDNFLKSFKQYQIQGGQLNIVSLVDPGFLEE